MNRAIVVGANPRGCPNSWGRHGALPLHNLYNWFRIAAIEPIWHLWGCKPFNHQPHQTQINFSISSLTCYLPNIGKILRTPSFSSLSNCPRSSAVKTVETPLLSDICASNTPRLKKTTSPEPKKTIALQLKSHSISNFHQSFRCTNNGFTTICRIHYVANIFDNFCGFLTGLSLKLFQLSIVISPIHDRLNLIHQTAIGYTITIIIPADVVLLSVAIAINRLSNLSTRFRWLC